MKHQHQSSSRRTNRESEESPPQRKSLPHDVPNWIRGEAIWFITICSKERNANTLTGQSASSSSTAVGQVLLDCAANYHAQQKWYLHLFLLMPDHLHALVSFARQQPMKKLIREWKSYTAKRAEIRWQRDFFDHRLRSNESFAEKANYIRNNPVRAGLVAKAEDWPWIWCPPASDFNVPRI